MAEKFSSFFSNKNRKGESSTSCSNQTEVALNIANHLFSKEQYHDKNIVFSPLSLYTVLSIIAAGSKGSTLDELLTFLQSDSVNHLNSLVYQVSALLFSAAPLSFANGVWGDQSLSLSSSFVKQVVDSYKAKVALLDFEKVAEVTHEVNSWVEKETSGLIKEILPCGSIDRNTKLIFVNALYFKGVWETKFDASRTNNHDFHLLNGTLVKFPFMISKKKEWFISAFDGFKVLGLPYKQGENKKCRFSMYIFLPNTKDGLSSLIRKMTSKCGFLEQKLPRRKVKARLLMIPRFKISFGLETSNVLKELGVTLPFSDQADLSKMTNFNSDKLHVNPIFHKASVEVNEEGTEATRATCATLRKGVGASISSGIEFVADHPFIFIIRENLTGTILFIGQMLNPLDGNGY